MKKILDKIERQIEADIYHGASLALYNEHWQEFYLGTLDGKQPVVPGLTYDLASVSKVVGVGTVLIQMVKEGVVKLDWPLRAYYPAFANNSVTIRQLLTHTSGIDPYIPNRHKLDAESLIEAINHIQVTSQHEFKYTDINFILLGLMLETLTSQTLANVFKQRVFKPFAMKETNFGPVSVAVPTVKGVLPGVVHDPKAKVLGVHTGSAGLFSTLKDLEKFLNAYLQRDFATYLNHNFAPSGSKERSLAWDKQGDWLLHTGYTGTFVLYNRKAQKAAIFLSNRTYERDERAQWILDRDQLITVIKEEL
ncbi:serine hydrolase domain-containing protein [Streptococcus tangpeifui]|uniref:serine hydrolase domain-containing protein n=1 Tax=Streptococcus tangpeifui TaxID=2709400 RepID=UPI0013ED1DDF|nr:MULTISPECIES: serine hydrolase domain-containing protein [unclassified Streptococcus]